MITNALTMATLATAGFYLLYKKLPRNVRRYIVKYSLLVDFLAMLATYLLFGGGITALMAGAIVDIMISAMLHVANHPQDFVWFFDTVENCKKLVEQVRVKLAEFNEAYKAKKANPVLEGIPV